MQAEPQRILIIRPSALGDVCRTVPVLVSLRRRYPQADIDWLVQDTFVPAIEAHPDLTGMVAFPRARFAHWWRSPGRLLELHRWASELRRRRYDLVLDCQGLGRSGVMSRYSGAPQRVGLRNARELAWLGYTLRVDSPETSRSVIHTVDEMLLLVEAIGIEPVRDMRLYVSDSNRHWWMNRRVELDLGDQPYVVVAPGSRWPGKNWPIERFVQLIEPLLMRGFTRIIVIGSQAESAQVRPLVEANARFKQPLVIDLTGQTSIGQSMAVIAEAGLLIANDSAPLHMAVGLGRRCVGLYGPTDPARVGPYRLPHIVVRGSGDGRGGEASFKHAESGEALMRMISHVAVLQCVDRVLALKPPQTVHVEERSPNAVSEPKLDDLRSVAPVARGPAR